MTVKYDCECCFNKWSEEEQGQHIEYEMLKISVNKTVGNKTPPFISCVHFLRIKNHFIDDIRVLKTRIRCQRSDTNEDIRDN